MFVCRARVNRFSCNCTALFLVFCVIMSGYKKYCVACKQMKGGNRKGVWSHKSYFNMFHLTDANKPVWVLRWWRNEFSIMLKKIEREVNKRETENSDGGNNDLCKKYSKVRNVVNSKSFLTLCIFKSFWE